METDKIDLGAVTRQRMAEELNKSPGFRADLAKIKTERKKNSQESS